VIVDEGISTASYLLDEALIDFGSAIDDRAYGRATDILETLELSPEAEGMWRQLSEDALAHGDLAVAERCAAALGGARAVCDASAATSPAALVCTIAVPAATQPHPMRSLRRGRHLWRRVPRGDSGAPSPQT
jgi:hypothetical protein